MLTNQWMGILALAILWVNTFVMIGAALKQSGAIRAKVRSWRLAAKGHVEGEFFGRGIVQSGAPLARHIVEQSGHSAAAAGQNRAKQAIVFHDRSRRSEVLGGVIEVQGKALSLPSGVASDVWVGREAQEQAVQAGAAARFDSVYPEATRARGFARQVELEITSGQEVWVAGVVQNGLLSAPQGRRLLLSALDPIVLCRAKCRALSLFALVTFVGALVCTLLSLYPPVFGIVSQIGAGLGLLFFLLIQPLGVVMRDFALSPVERPLLGKWKASQVAGSELGVNRSTVES